MVKFSPLAPFSSPALEGGPGGGRALWAVACSCGLCGWLLWIVRPKLVDPFSSVSCALCRQDILKSLCAAAGAEHRAQCARRAARVWGLKHGCSLWVGGSGGRGGARSPSHVRPQGGAVGQVRGVQRAVPSAYPKP